MLRTACTVILVAAWCSGGCTLGPIGIRRGTGITVVQADLGLPDVISDESGDFTRLYTPQNRPASEWPSSAPRTFYYLGRDLQITFVNGKATKASRIDPGLREASLLPVLRGAGVGRGREAGAARPVPGRVVR